MIHYVRAENKRPLSSEWPILFCYVKQNWKCKRIFFKNFFWMDTVSLGGEMLRRRQYVRHWREMVLVDGKQSFMDCSPFDRLTGKRERNRKRLKTVTIFQQKKLSSLLRKLSFSRFNDATHLLNGGSHAVHERLVVFGFRLVRSGSRRFARPAVRAVFNSRGVRQTSAFDNLKKRANIYVWLESKETKVSRYLAVSNP